MNQTKLFKGLLVATLLLCSLYASAYDFTARNDGNVLIYYTILSEEDLTCEVTYHDKKSTSNKDAYTGSVVIPETTTYLGKTYSVVAIEEYAFYYCSGLKGVTIPNSVTSIGSYAFYSCSGLTEITIPNSVTSIGSYAFYGCSSLKEVTIPNSVTTIEDETFYKCTSLTEITIPNSVTTIGWGAFDGCTGLTSVTIPDSVTTIGDYAFYRCEGLTSVIIGNSVTSIGERAFYGCSSLKNVTIGNSVTSIEDNAFYKCSSIITITSLNPEPPSCSSSALESVSKTKCALYIPLGTTNVYSTAKVWKEFYIIEEIDTSDVKSITTDDAEVTGYYTIDGKAVDAPQRGVNIVKFSDGSTKKLLVK